MSDELIQDADDGEGGFGSGGNPTENVELEPERDYEEEEMFNPPSVKDGQPLLDFLRKNLHKFDAPYSYIGGEANSPSVKQLAQAKVKVLIARLSGYEACNLSMAHSLLAQIVEEEPYAGADFAFMPRNADFDLLRKAGMPAWFGLNTKWAPYRFDTIWISHAVQMEQLNCIPALHQSGIPIFKQQRMEREDIPLIVLGGANAGTVSALMGAYVAKDGTEWSCLVDAVLFGEGEEQGREILRVIYEGKQKGWTKKQIMRAMHGRVRGLYEPDLYKHHILPSGKITKIEPLTDYAEFPVERATVLDLNKVRALEGRLLPYSGDGMEIDVGIASTVGCVGSAGHGACSFCREGSEGPYRERSLKNVVETLDIATRKHGTKEVTLFGLNFNSHSEFFPMVYECVKKGYDVGMISQRIDILAQTPEQIRVQRWCGKISYSLGVEGISQRMRDYLNKNLTEEDLLKVIRVMMEEKATELKFYCIVTGLEEQRDIDEWKAFVDKVEMIRAETGAWKSHCRISFTVLFPSAGTALQYAPVESAIKFGTRSLDSIFAKAREVNWGRRLSVSGDLPICQNLMNFAGRAVTPLLFDAWFKDRLKFYGTVPRGSWDRWKKRAIALGLDLEMIWAEKPFEWIFPWDDLSYATTREAMYKAYQRCKRFEAERYCLTTQEVRGVCHWQDCGVCDPYKTGKPVPNIIQNIVNRKVAPVITAKEMERVARSWEKGYHARVLFTIADPIYRFVIKNYFGHALPRALMMVSEDFANNFIRAIGNARSGAGACLQNDWTYGKNIWDLALYEPRHEADLKKLIEPANKIFREGQILDIRVDVSLRKLSTEIDFAMYSMFVQNSSKMNYAIIRDSIGRYFERKMMGKSSTIHVKVAKAKGAYRTEERTLDGQDIRTVEYQWVPEYRGTLVRFVVSSSYNPFAMLEAVTGRKAFQWKPYPVFCDGYFSLDDVTGEADVFAALAGDASQCKECGGPLERDLFSGEAHSSGVCVECDSSSYPVDMSQFFTKELMAVRVD